MQLDHVIHPQEKQNQGEPFRTSLFVILSALLFLGCCYSAVADEPVTSGEVVMLDVQGMT